MISWFTNNKTFDLHWMNSFHGCSRQIWAALTEEGTCFSKQKFTTLLLFSLLQNLSKYFRISCCIVPQISYSFIDTVSLMFTTKHTFIHVEGANELINLCFGCNYLCDTETGNQGALFVRILGRQGNSTCFQKFVIRHAAWSKTITRWHRRSIKKKYFLEWGDEGTIV